MPVRILRVGDGVQFEAGAGWSTEGHYQADEILRAFAAAGEPASLCAFGRILRDGSSSAIPLDTAKVRPGGIVVSQRGVWPVLRQAGRVADALRREMARADAVWAMLPSLLGVLALHLNRGARPSIAQLVGDPRRSIALRSGRWRDRAGGVLGAALVRRAIARADGAVFVSDALRRAYLDQRPQLWTVANESRISEEQIVAEREAAKRIREKTGAAWRVIYVGRLSAEKGIRTLLDAITACGGSSLTLVGDGPERARLEEAAQELSIAGRVRFQGAVPWGERLLSLIREHSCLVLPSLTEGLGLTLIEAMSQGVPVIASAVGGIPELVEDRVTGLLVPPGDAGMLAGAIRRLLSDQELQLKLMGGALERSRAHTCERQYGKAVEIVRTVMARRR